MQSNTFSLFVILIAVPICRQFIKLFDYNRCQRKMRNVAKNRASVYGHLCPHTVYSFLILKIYFCVSRTMQLIRRISSFFASIYIAVVD